MYKWKSLRCGFKCQEMWCCCCGSIFISICSITCINMGNQCGGLRKNAFVSIAGVRLSGRCRRSLYSQAQLHSEANGMPSSGKLTESCSGGIMRQARAVYNIIIWVCPAYNRVSDVPWAARLNRISASLLFYARPHVSLRFQPNAISRRVTFVHFDMRVQPFELNTLAMQIKFSLESTLKRPFWFVKGKINLVVCFAMRK